MFLSTLGCLTDIVPYVLVQISSFLLSKKTGFSITARISSLPRAEHFKAIFFTDFNVSYSSFDTGRFMGTEKWCLFPSGVVIVFICMTSRTYISFINPVMGLAHPYPMVWRY